MQISNEELENYLKQWQEAKEDKVTVDKELFLTLAKHSDKL